MGQLTSLKDVNATILPSPVLVLLSKYAQAARKHTGLAIRISSMNVFSHIHNTSKLTEHPEVLRLHHDLLHTVNQHLAAGTMHTNEQRLQASMRPMTQRFQTESQPVSISNF